MSAAVPPELTRHYRELSETETNEVVEAVADLIVNFLTRQSDPVRAGGDGPDMHETANNSRRGSREGQR